NGDERKAGAKLCGTYCGRCQEGIDGADPDRTVKAQKTPLREVRTDPLMATNFANRRGKTGPLEGRKTTFLVGSPFGKEAGGDEILTHVVIGVILNTEFNDYQESDLLR